MKDENESKEIIISELKSIKKKISELEGVVVDSVTGVYNRGYFFDLAKHEFLRAKRYSRPLSALMIDIEYVGELEPYHDSGLKNYLIAEVTERMKTSLRKSDIIGKYDGKNFAILLPEANVDEAKKVANRLLRELTYKTIATENGAVEVLVNIGVSKLSKKMTSLGELIELADSAHYTAKRKGPNTIVIEG